MKYKGRKYPSRADAHRAIVYDWLSEGGRVREADYRLWFQRGDWALVDIIERGWALNHGITGYDRSELAKAIGFFRRLALGDWRG